MMKFKLLISFFICIFNSSSGMAIQLKPDEQLYKIKFDHINHPKEQEIVYQYLLEENQKYNISDDNLQKEQIGIDLYDINGDGNKEILAYINNSAYCGSAGCACIILKSINNSDKYSSIFRLNIYEMKILPNKNLSFYDISLSVHSGFSKYDNSTPPDSEEMIMRWQGDHYVEVDESK